VIRKLATGASAFSTFVQVLPRLASVVKRMRPTWHLPSLASVDEAFLKQHGIRGLIWDIDGTLTGDRLPDLHEHSAEAFRSLMAMPGITHVVLSNSGEERYRQLGIMFPELPILRGYRHNGQVLFRRLHAGKDSWSADELKQRLADGARMIRKPSRELVEYALSELKLAASEVAMLGDQYMTDVAGANYGGVRSIKLPTIAHETFRTSVRISQRIENIIYTVVHRGHGRR